MGVATGIVMEFEIGTSWAVYSRFVGDVFGSVLAAEGIFALFLESGFLAVLVFGWDRVGPKMHLFSTLMVFLGSMFSAVWIVLAARHPHTFESVKNTTFCRGKCVSNPDRLGKPNPVPNTHESPATSRQHTGSSRKSFERMKLLQ
jgi:cytochrome bd-type quinol oxidase subunit 1